MAERQVLSNVPARAGPQPEGCPVAGPTAEEARRRQAAALANTTAVPTSRPVREILRTNFFTRFNAMLGGLLVVILWPWVTRVLALAAPTGALLWWTLGAAAAGAALVEVIWRLVRVRVIGYRSVTA